MAAASPELLQRETFELVVQVNGKVRDRLEVPVDLPEEEVVEQAFASPRVQALLDGGEVRAPWSSRRSWSTSSSRLAAVSLRASAARSVADPRRGRDLPWSRSNR